MKMVKLFITSCILLSIFIMVGFKPFINYPQKRDFSLSTTISKKKLKVGEKLILKTTFRNLTNMSIKVGYGNDFGCKKIININVFGSDNKKHLSLSDDILRLAILKPKQVITEIKEIVMKNPDKYDVVAYVNFNCYNSKGEAGKLPIVITNNYSIEVKAK